MPGEEVQRKHQGTDDGDSKFWCFLVVQFPRPERAKFVICSSQIRDTFVRIGDGPLMELRGNSRISADKNAHGRAQFLPKMLLERIIIGD
jgi:hypothetical protein